MKGEQQLGAEEVLLITENAPEGGQLLENVNVVRPKADKREAVVSALQARGAEAGVPALYKVEIAEKDGQITGTGQIVAFPSVEAQQQAATQLRTILLAPLRAAGFWSIVWAIGNMALNWDFIDRHGGDPMAQFLVVLSAAMLIEGLICLARPSPGMFIWDGLIFLALALVNIVGGIQILGAFQVYLGFKQFGQYWKVARSVNRAVARLQPLRAAA